MGLKLVITSVLLFSIFTFGEDSKWPAIPLDSKSLIELKVKTKGDYDYRQRAIAEPISGRIWLIKDNEKYEIVAFKKVESWRTKDKTKNFANLNLAYEQSLKSTRKMVVPPKEVKKK